EIITSFLAGKYGIRILPLLYRGNTRQQKTLDFKERVVNLRGKIGIKGKTQQLPEKLVLLDDIFTTGSTANECSRVLLSSGVKTIHVLTLAID
ncbi:MAG: ComF family protein, partial [Spirochaetota bacterium]